MTLQPSAVNLIELLPFFEALVTFDPSLSPIQIDFTGGVNLKKEAWCANTVSTPIHWLILQNAWEYTPHILHKQQRFWQTWNVLELQIYIGLPSKPKGITKELISEHFDLKGHSWEEMKVVAIIIDQTLTGEIQGELLMAQHSSQLPYN